MNGDTTEVVSAEVETLALQQPVEFDQALVNQLSKAVDAYKQIIGIAIRLTNPHDWVNQNGKPYLQCSGAEKIASPFLVTMGKPTRERLERDDDKGKSYIWVYEAMFSSQRLGRSIVAQGKCSSRDSFFGIAKDKTFKPMDEIKEEDVMQAAYTNCFVNGITRLIGIRNLTWEQLSQGGIDQDKIGRVEYKDAKAAGSSESAVISDPQRKRLYAIAKGKGWSDEAIKSHLAEKYQITTTTEVKKADYEAICAYFEAGPQPGVEF